MNDALATVVVAPLTSTLNNYSSSVNCLVKNKKGQIALHQLRCIEKSKLRQKLSVLNDNEQDEVLSVLSKIFSK